MLQQIIHVTLIIIKPVGTHIWPVACQHLVCVITYFLKIVLVALVFVSFFDLELKYSQLLI